MFLGDEGGISCCVGILKKGEVVVTSLTHIRVANSHTLGKDIRKYQKMRVDVLAAQNIRREQFK